MKTSQWRRVVEKRCIFSARLKALSNRSGDHSAGGRRFHVAGPLTAKLRCPVAVRARGGQDRSGPDTCYSATYTSQTRDQQHFTISEVAADWHEPMVPQRIMCLSIARANGQLDPWCS